MEDKYVDIQKLAEHFMVSVSTVRAWIRKGVLPAESYLKVGSTFRFKLPEVEAALRNYTKTQDNKMTNPQPVSVDEDF
jgi:excisionase family DNA binding protein